MFYYSHAAVIKHNVTEDEDVTYQAYRRIAALLLKVAWSCRRFASPSV